MVSKEIPKKNLAHKQVPTIYICVYGQYNPEQPRISKLASSLIKTNYRINWIVSSGSGENVISMNTKSKCIYFLKATAYLRWHLKPQDMVFCYVHIGGIVGFFSTLFKKTKFIYDYPDPWVGWYYYKTPNDNLKWKVGRRIFYWLEKILYKSATYVTTASFSQLEFLQKQHGKKNNSSVILNCADIKTFNGANCDKELQKKLKLENKTILIYLGTIVEEYGCDILIEAFTKVLKKIPDAHLLFLGKAKFPSFQKHLNQLVQKYKLEKAITFIPPVSRSQVPQFLNIAKIGFVPFKDRFYNNVGSPNKLFEYMACGVVPIVSDMVEFKQYITNKKNGFLVKPEDSEELAKRTIEALSNKTLLESIAKQNKKTVETIYNWDAQEKKFLEVIKAVNK